MQDYATLKAAYDAERRACDMWQLRGYVAAFVGGVLGLMMWHTSSAIGLAFIIVGGIGGLVCALVSVTHQVRRGRYRRAMAALEGGQVRWYTGLTDTPEQKAATVMLWRRHPIVLSLYVGSIVVITVVSLLVRLALH